MSTKKLTELSLLTALALIIFIIELRIPNLCPIQGVKLGLANIITVYAVYRYKASEAAMVAVTRVLLGAFFSGSLSALIYSMSGAVLCLAGMLVIRKAVPEKYIWLCSVAGAIFHNIGQIGAAMVVMHSTAVLAYLPILMTTGCIAGAFTGFCAGILSTRIEKIRSSGCVSKH